MLLKPDELPSLTTSYRPISLIGLIMKLFERVIEQWLRSHLEHTGFINKHQLGFRKAKSTDDHLFRLSQSIMESFNRGEHAAKLLQQDLLKLAMWCAKWRIKPNQEKTKVIIFSRSVLARKTELNLKLYGKTLKIYPQVKFLGITFDSLLTFKKHFEDILDRCNTRYYRLRLLANKKWGPSPSTLIQIYKQCVRPIFEYGSLSTITTSDNIISKLQRLQNKFIRLALRLPKYICTKLLHYMTPLAFHM